VQIFFGYWEELSIGESFSEKIAISVWAGLTCDVIQVHLYNCTIPIVCLKNLLMFSLYLYP